MAQCAKQTVCARDAVAGKSTRCSRSSTRKVVGGRSLLSRQPEYIDQSLKPHGWYKDVVLAVARNTAYSRSIAEYIQSLEGK